MDSRVATDIAPIRALISALIGTLALAGGLAGCGAEEATAPPQLEVPRASPPLPSSPSAPAAVPELPPRGVLRLDRQGRRVEIAAHRVSLEEVLDKLSSELGFSIQVHTDLTDRSVTLRRPFSPLQEILDELLQGLPYAIESEWDPESGLRLERRLVVGTSNERVARQLAGAALRAASQMGNRAATGDYDETEFEEEFDFGEDVDEDEESDPVDRPLEELLRDLESREGIVRARAAAAIEPAGAGLEALLQVLDRDPDPRVRVAAAERLEDATTYGGVQGLLRALEDRDSRVVVAAMEALEFAGDESNVPEIERYKNHRDKDVRRAAREAIDFLRD